MSYMPIDPHGGTIERYSGGGLPPDAAYPRIPSGDFPPAIGRRYGSPVYIYLAGPVTGHEGNPAIETWRQDLGRQFAPGIIGISPLRFEPARKLANDPIWGCAHSIWHKNRMDIKRCDATVAFLPKSLSGAGVSVGTILELGGVIEQDKPTVIVSDDPWVTENRVAQQSVGWIVPTLDLAATIINGLYAAYAMEVR